MERMKQGYQFLLPSICIEIFSGNQNKDDFSHVSINIYFKQMK